MATGVQCQHQGLSNCHCRFNSPSIKSILVGRVHQAVTQKKAQVVYWGDAYFVNVREQLRLARPVFAHYLRTNPRTLENWEQGRAKPNAQASLLIRMVAQFPDMVQRLAGI